MALETGSETVLDPETRKQKWLSITNSSLEAARTDIKRRHTEITENPRDYKTTSHSRKGRILQCNVDAYGAEAEHALPVGMMVKIISEKEIEEFKAAPRRKEINERSTRISDWHYPERHRKPKKKRMETTVLRGVVKSVNVRDEMNPIIRVELTTKGHIFPAEEGGTVRILPRDQLSDLNKYSGLLDPKKRTKNRPMAAFLKGEFEPGIPEDLEKREGLDEAQQKAHGMAMKIEENPLLFVHGGPGTGKTRTICSIVEDHVKRGRKVLVLSHSNKGSQVPAVMLKKMRDKDRKTGCPVYIAGNDASVVDPRLHKDRIRRGVNFPHEKLRAIAQKEWNPEEFRGKKVNFKAHRKELKGNVMAEYDKKLAEAGRRLDKKIENGGAVFSTLGTLLNDKLLLEREFDVVIVDEATRLRMPDLMLALKKAGKQIILVGDPLQLGNIPFEPKERDKIKEELTKARIEEIRKAADEEVLKRIATEIRDAIRFILPEAVIDIDNIDEETCIEWVEMEAEAKIKFYEEGPFSKAILSCEDPEKELPYVFLNQDRRSRPNIVKILSELIYGGKLLPGRKMEENEHHGIVQWIDTGPIEAEERRSGTSVKNTKEANVIVDKVLDKILAKGNKSKQVPPEDIAVIATYAEQARLIRSELTRRLSGTAKNKALLERLLPNVASVDAFQGDERKIVFVSMTRSNEEGSIGFLEEQRRIGVAIGRAQDELYVVGDLKTLTVKNDNPESKKFFGKMNSLIKENGVATKIRYQSPAKRRTKNRRMKEARRENLKRQYLKLAPDPTDVDEPSVVEAELESPATSVVADEMSSHKKPRKKRKGQFVVPDPKPIFEFTKDPTETDFERSVRKARFASKRKGEILEADQEEILESLYRPTNREARNLKRVQLHLRPTHGEDVARSSEKKKSHRTDIRKQKYSARDQFLDLRFSDSDTAIFDKVLKGLDVVDLEDLKEALCAELRMELLTHQPNYNSLPDEMVDGPNFEDFAESTDDEIEKYIESFVSDLVDDVESFLRFNHSGLDAVFSRTSSIHNQVDELFRLGLGGLALIFAPPTEVNKFSQAKTQALWSKNRLRSWAKGERFPAALQRKIDDLSSLVSSLQTAILSDEDGKNVLEAKLIKAKSGLESLNKLKGKLCGIAFHSLKAATRKVKKEKSRTRITGGISRKAYKQRRRKRKNMDQFERRAFKNAVISADTGITKMASKLGVD